MSDDVLGVYLEVADVLETHQYYAAATAMRDLIEEVKRLRDDAREFSQYAVTATRAK